MIRRRYDLPSLPLPGVICLPSLSHTILGKPRKIQNPGLCSLQFRTAGNWDFFTTVVISSFISRDFYPYPMYVYVCLFFQCSSPGGARTNVYSMFSLQQENETCQISTNHKFLYPLHCSPIWILKLFTNIISK